MYSGLFDVCLRFTVILYIFNTEEHILPYEHFRKIRKKNMLTHCNLTDVYNTNVYNNTQWYAESSVRIKFPIP